MVSGMGRKRLAQHAADSDMLVDLLQRMFDLMGPLTPDSGLSHIPGLRQYTVGQLGGLGAEMVTAMHRAAHGMPGNVPSLGQLNGWRVEATSLTSLLSVHDSEWYSDYWRQKFQSGFKVPKPLAADLERQGIATR
jgi:hypothetical protein